MRFYICSDVFFTHLFSTGEEQKRKKKEKVNMIQTEKET